jgi:hypothetical protein
MICTHCNASLNRHARFCPHCGTPVISSTQETQAASGTDEKTVSFQPDIPERPVILHARSLELKHYNSVPAASGPIISVKVSTPDKVSASKDIETPKVASEIPQPRNSIPELPTVMVDLDHLPDKKNKGQNNNIPDEEPAPRAQEPLFLTTEDLRTQPVPLETITHPELLEPEQRLQPVPTTNQSQLEQANPLLYYQLNITTKGSQMLPAVVHTSAKPKRRGKAAGCLFGCLTTLVILLLVIGVSWVFIGRPYLHNIAQTQLNSAMDAGVNQMPTGMIQQLPSGQTLPITENLLSNMIAFNVAPSSPVKNPSTSITNQNVKLSFDVYGYPCDISLVPAEENGNLVATNVHVDGIFSWIMSSDEMTQILNQHFAAAQKKIGRVITGVQLKNQSVEITFG